MTELKRYHADTITEHPEGCLVLAAEVEALINTPRTEQFLEAVKLEAAHQVERFGAEHDMGKSPEDWFWLLGYLAGKALAAAKAGDQEKAMHHTISSAAALMNWHVHLVTGASRMRPGIEPPAEAPVEGKSA